MAKVLDIAEGVTDWEQYGYGDGVLCEFRPRAEYSGRGLKAGLIEKTGLQLLLHPLWRMDDGDKYPGEHALTINPNERTKSNENENNHTPRSRVLCLVSADRMRKNAKLQ